MHGERRIRVTLRAVARLEEMPAEERAHLEAKACEPFATRPWVNGPPLAERRVALVTTAGLHRRGDAPFAMFDTSYRVIPGDVAAADLSMSNSSVHFDRSGFREDANLVFPIDCASSRMTASWVPWRTCTTR